MPEAATVPGYTRGLCGRPAVSVFAAMAFFLAAGIASPAQADGTKPAAADRTAVTGILDGKTFSGQFGSIGKRPLTDDTWIFSNGTFMSMQCEKCGYPRGVYRTHRQPDGSTGFVVETPCPVSDARITWRGTIDEGRIRGVATWTRKRWYRTITKKYWFKGTLKSAAPASADQ